LKAFYPTSLLITGYDILFFWVARMIMMGQYAMGEAPFPEVFLHGLVFGKSYWRDKPGGGVSYCSSQERAAFDAGKAQPSDVHSRWEKMSKSKGNVIDILEMIDEYGTDATRMTLITCPVSSRQIDLDQRRFEEFKFFANKFWNGARFVLMSLNLEGQEPFTLKMFMEGLNFSMLSTEDHWILNTLNQTIDCVNYHLDEYQFDQAAEVASEFFWDQFCAWYVEICKPVLYGKGGQSTTRREKLKILFIVLEHTVRLLHPFAPFITEELFQELKSRCPVSKEAPDDIDPFTKSTLEALAKEACIVSPYPQKVSEPRLEKDIHASFKQVQELIYTIRNLRGEMKISPTTSTDVIIQSTNAAGLQDNQHIVKALVRIESLTFTQEEKTYPNSSLAITKEAKVIIPLPAELQIREKERLTKELERARKEVETLTNKLSNHSFLEKAPPSVVEKHKTSLDAALKNEKTLCSKLTEMSQ
jgi:valyl-tRNA synthetase